MNRKQLNSKIDLDNAKCAAVVAIDALMVACKKYGHLSAQAHEARKAYLAAGAAYDAVLAKHRNAVLRAARPKLKPQA